MDNHEHIGFLADNNVVFCIDCVTKGRHITSNKEPELTRLVRGNVHPYSQKCSKCRKMIHHGGSGLWPELYSVDEDIADTVQTF